MHQSNQKRLRIWIGLPLFVLFVAVNLRGQTGSPPPTSGLPRPDSVLLGVFNTGNKYRLTPAEFGAPSPSFANGQNSLVSSVVFAKDTSLRHGNQGCDTIRVNLRGKVALVERGGCSFVRKCLNAQRAGAIAVILIDTVPNGVAPVMTKAGADSTLADSITIPCYSVSKQKGERIRALLPSKVGIRIPQEMPSDAERRGNTTINPVASTPEPTRDSTAVQGTTAPTAPQTESGSWVATQQRLYPNPTTGVVFLDYTYADIANLTIQIRNIGGQVVLEQKVAATQSGKLEIDVSDFGAGTYFVRLVHGSHQSVKMLIVQN